MGELGARVWGTMAVMVVVGALHGCASPRPVPANPKAEDYSKRILSDDDMLVRPPVCNLHSRRVAVMDFGDRRDFSLHLTSELLKESIALDVSSRSEAELVERSSRRLGNAVKSVPVIVARKDIDAALKELEFQQSALVDERTAVKVGNLLGADLILHGKGRMLYVSRPETRQIGFMFLIERAAVLEVGTGRTLWSITSYNGNEVKVPLDATELSMDLAELKAAKDCAERLVLQQFRWRIGMTGRSP